MKENWLCDVLEAQLKSAEEVRMGHGRLVRSILGKVG
jgi:hypothetical protein